MDFGTLLSVAQKNEINKQSVACYQTKFTPPKKQNKQSKTLSDNIKKFLARKEEEEKRKVLEEKKKRDNLLALRDHKAQSRINKHLKVCKAANKSVIADAIDNENTAVTIAGPSQPDEDDYGYVSQEASAFYNQLMNKYSNLPPEKPLFSNTGKRTVKDIALTKDRVKQALKQQEIEDSLGHRRKRRSSTVNRKESECEDQNEKVPEKKTKEQEKHGKEKAKKKPPPPPMDFGELLKLAEKKQHEPVVIDAKPKVEEPERLMTKKQMKEYMKEKEWRERKEQLARGIDVTKKNNVTSEINKSNKSHAPKSTKITIDKSSLDSSVQNKNLSSTIQDKKAPTKSNNNILSEKSNVITKSNNIGKNSTKDKLLEERKKLEAEKRKLEEMRKAIEKEKLLLAQSKLKQEESKSLIKHPNKVVSQTKSTDKQVLSKDIKTKQAPTSEKLQSSMLNEKPKQFPPLNMKSLKNKIASGKILKKPGNSNKRRIYDDEEYDSELDDFIDDGPEEEGEDYSKYISEIFGYDKSKYRNVDDDDDDLAMESNFAQQLKEEYVSTKIGIMEDLEDIRMEALEKKRKALLKKKARK
ncbi:protein SPT2 homolog [Vespa velutina]|uniref:protein SPT2 homolog n=1 Tax=Vespa velutina TaxID=202808 RepID=UPI001FB4AF5B|nr:protein SPT2 homolog [Vespa velutina]